MTPFRQFLAMSFLKWALIMILMLWSFFVFIYISKLNVENVLDSDYKMTRLNQATTSAEQSEKRNAELEALIDEYLSDKSIRPEQKWKLIDVIESKLVPYAALRNKIIEPSVEYEKLRRRVQSNTQEMWNYVNSEMIELKKIGNPGSANFSVQIDAIINAAAEQKNSLLHDLDQLAEVDGYEAWRLKEAAELSDLMQRRLHHLQNPEDCGKARKLMCPLEVDCGYGCELHHVVYCLIMAYATERTLPISDTCLTSEGASYGTWSNDIQNIQVVDIPRMDNLIPQTPFLPQVIPEDLAPRLTRLHGDPFVWWVGQFLKYLLRMQPQTHNMVDGHRQKLGFTKPIVGVHVRRTDKLTQVKSHNVEEYMIWVEDYFNRLEMSQPVVKRRVFLATDDPKVIEEARKKYPKYDIIGDPDVARTAAVSTRYSNSSLNGIISDTHLLSMCDYVVCTFSSQVCRMAYEFMQTMYPDASNRFKSVDTIYFFYGTIHNREAVISHRAKNTIELSMNVSDTLKIFHNLGNGFSKGKSLQTNQTGIFPSFKVVSTVETADFPKYMNIN
ncbi:alpha-(1,6)-fucosyltransferase-like [Bradysia coprophila]|uniref:alpha-(1,6)-fucosyltransferase-like n=1 Tax=Bradysia coprophila TaxID=38358 RepID=UPI00187D7B56|nr:alpha-(1,6)-fucosyltransferase-like [Bradysia coprophila]